jgi:hypothetical protein
MDTNQNPADFDFQSLPHESSGDIVQIDSAREDFRVPFRGRATALVYPLYPASAKANAEPVESEVLTTDISRGGLSVLHRRALQPGQQILLMLTESSRMVEVCWCCRVWPGLYAAGCRFLDVTCADEVILASEGG